MSIDEDLAVSLEEAFKDEAASDESRDDTAELSVDRTVTHDPTEL